MYTYIIQTFGVVKIFKNVFETTLLCSPRLSLFDQKYIKNRNIVKFVGFGSHDFLQPFHHRNKIKFLIF